MQTLTNFTFILLTLSILLGCKASMDTDQNGNPIAGARIDFQVYCSKFIRLKIDNSKVTSIDALREGIRDGEAKASLKSNEFLGTMTYKLVAYPDGSRDITCTLTDGSRQFMGNSSVSKGHAPYSDNLCSVVYDLNDASFGTFSFYWNNEMRGVSYNDDNYSRSLFVRSDECSEL